MLHDARTGFYDIKPIELSVGSWLWALLVLAAAGTAFLAWYLRRKEAAPLPPPLSALEIFRRTALEIKAGNASPEKKASALSMALRALIGKLLEIPGEDLTRMEIKRELAQVLPRALPRVNAETRSMFTNELDELLRTLDRFAFQPTTEKKELLDLFKQADVLADKLFRGIENERQRMQSVTETQTNAA